MEKEKDSGYRIRFNLLELARGILSERQNVFLDTVADRKDFKPFTTEDVLKEAEKLYEFVVTKKRATT